MPRFEPGDRVKVNSEKGRGEATVVGMDPLSGVFSVRFDAVEAKDDKGHTVHLDGGMGYVPAQQMTKRRKS